MKRNKPLFISFEGIDGSGKTTQIKLLYKKLLKNNIKCILTREPGGTDFGKKIRNILLHNKSIKLSKRSEMQLYACDRTYHIENLILPALNHNTYVLSDRYIDSNLAYQNALGIPYDEIIDSNSYAFNNCMPDITLYLKIDFKTYKKRNKNKNKDKIEMRGEQFVKKVIKNYDTISKKYKNRYKVIDATKNIKEVENSINKIIEKLI